MNDFPSVVLLVLLGTWSALDGTSFGQFLVSRPLVCGTLSGWILGDPVTGLWIGVVLEGAHLGELPVGGARLPEPGPAAVPAVAVASALGGHEGLAAGAALGVIWSLIGGFTVVGLRHLNGILTRPPSTGWSTLSPSSFRRQLARRHWTCLAMDGLRGATVTSLALAVVAALPPSVADRWPFGPFSTAALLLSPMLLAAGSLFRRWSRSARRGVVFGVACVLGAALSLMG